MSPFLTAFLNLHHWTRGTRTHEHLKEVRLIFDTPYYAAQASTEIDVAYSGKAFGIPFTITSDPR